MTFTFDTGMLVAIERQRPRAVEVFHAIVRRGYLPIVPAIVYAEWWRGRAGIAQDLAAAVVIEDLTAPVARLAGEALASVRAVSVGDAIVMASAALRGGGVVYSSDYVDLSALQRFFPMVRVLRT
ncbi:MAG: uncharacterized protein JWP97_4687 [Labilithrix sp.]|nr:uncharacterized protein [Labilithrix sp.]